MDLSYTSIPNSDGVLVRVYREPFYEGHFERLEYGMRQTYREGELYLEGVYMFSGNCGFGEDANEKERT